MFKLVTGIFQSLTCIFQLLTGIFKLTNWYIQVRKIKKTLAVQSFYTIKTCIIFIEPIFFFWGGGGGEVRHWQMRK